MYSRSLPGIPSRKLRPDIFALYSGNTGLPPWQKSAQPGSGGNVSGSASTLPCSPLNPAAVSTPYSGRSHCLPMNDTSSLLIGGKRLPQHQRHAVVIRSGPNGLAAAIVLAQAGYGVEVHEAQSTIGGGARTLPLTLPGFHHDFGSAIHAMAIGSPFFSTLPLAEHGIEWIHPP